MRKNLFERAPRSCLTIFTSIFFSIKFDSKNFLKGFFYRFKSVIFWKKNYVSAIKAWRKYCQKTKDDILYDLLVLYLYTSTLSLVCVFTRISIYCMEMNKIFKSNLQKDCHIALGIIEFVLFRPCSSGQITRCSESDIEHKMVFSDVCNENCAGVRNAKWRLFGTESD